MVNKGIRQDLLGGDETWVDCVVYERMNKDR